MVEKKESAKRGYMTQKEIYSHLEELVPYEGYQGNEAKISYLNSVLNKKGFISKPTEKNIYKLIRELESTKKDENLGEISGREVIESGEDYEAKAREYLLEGKKDMADNMMYEAAAEYSESRQHERAGKIFADLNHFDRAADEYVLAGKGMKAKMLRNKHRTEEKALDNLLEPKKIGTTLSIVGVLAGTILLQPTITGNAVAGLISTIDASVGAILIVAGLAGLFLYSKKK